MSCIRSKKKGCNARICSPYSVIMLTALALAMAVSGCISGQDSNNQVHFTGYVRSASDSSAIPEAALIIDCFSLQNSHSGFTRSNSSGYYEEHFTIPTDALSGQTDLRVWLLVVFDVDGDSNGSFASRDTLLNEFDPLTVRETHFEVDFYVEMKEL